MFPPESPRLRLYTPSSILPHYTLLSSLVPCTPIPTHNPRPWGICTDSALECQAQESDTQHAGCGQKGMGSRLGEIQGKQGPKGNCCPSVLALPLCPSASVLRPTVLSPAVRMKGSVGGLPSHTLLSPRFRETPCSQSLQAPPLLLEQKGNPCLSHLPFCPLHFFLPSPH